jgi:glycerophosphoryl diester phosphodiesterase
MNSKLFSHRGFLQKKPNLNENTLESFQNAIDNQFKAIEVDVWYIDKELILNHDKPENDLAKYNKLSDLLKKFSNNIEYWIDFKNLNISNTKDAIFTLKTTIDRFNIEYQKLIIIPHSNSNNIEESLFALKEIKKTFKNKCHVGSFIKKIDQQDWKAYHQKLEKHNIKNLSIQFNNINEQFIKQFHNINLFAWTVNDKNDYDYLKKLKIKNIASDILSPKNIKEAQ